MEKPEEPRVRRRMIEKPKDGFENPEMYKKHERKSKKSIILFDQVVKRLFIHDKWCNSATEAEKKQNWLENRLGNMVKEEGDAEDLNAAAEVVRYESKYMSHTVDITITCPILIPIIFESDR